MMKSLAWQSKRAGMKFSLIYVNAIKCDIITSNFPRLWLQRVSQHSNSQQQLDMSSDTLPPHLFENVAHPTRSCDPKLSSFLSTHSLAHGPNGVIPTTFSHSSQPHRLPRILPLLAAALMHNSCDSAEAFQGLFAFCLHTIPFCLFINIFVSNYFTSYLVSLVAF
jgi:hypothetical protein